jgi:pyrroloquinoline quinone (PQQ) biosynthesis protein C
MILDVTNQMEDKKKAGELICTSSDLIWQYCHLHPIRANSAGAHIIVIIGLW